MKRSILLIVSVIAATTAGANLAQAQNPQESDAPAEGGAVAPALGAPAPADPTAPPAAPAAQGEDEQEGTGGEQAAALGQGSSAQSPAPTEPEVLMAEADAEEAVTTPASDTDGAADEDALPWAGSLFLFDQSYGITGFFRGAQLSYNPTYVWSFSLRPRWALSEDWAISARQDLALELTESDSTVRERQPILGDTSFTLSRANIYEIEGIKLAGSATLSLPLSMASRASGLLFATGLGVSASRKFAGVMKGLSLGLSLGYSHNWATRNVAFIDDAYPCHSVDPNLPVVCEQAGGPSNISDSFTAGLSASLSPIEGLSVDVGMAWVFRAARSLADASFSASGRDYTIEDGSLTHWRNLASFSLGVGYDLQKWVNLSASLSTFSSQLNPDGSLRNPFFNYDTSVSLTATFTLDEVYRLIEPASAPAEQNPTRTASRAPNRGRQ